MLDEEDNLVIIENEEDLSNAISYFLGELYTVNDHPALEEDWDKVSSSLQAAAETSILANVAKPFAYIFAPITGNEKAWQLSAACITGFIAKENVVGTLAVCYGTPNKINEDFEIVVDSVIYQKSKFNVNKSSVNAEIGDVVFVKGLPFFYLGIIRLMKILKLLVMDQIHYVQ